MELCVLIRTVHHVPSVAFTRGPQPSLTTTKHLASLCLSDRSDADKLLTPQAATISLG